MNTIFGDFCRLSAEKNQCYDQIFGKVATVRAKNADIFAKFFGKNIFKIITSVPGVDVMITIFCDLCQFSAKKIGVFLKNQCYGQIFAKK
jgi:hypothetical protein